MILRNQEVLCRQIKWCFFRGIGGRMTCVKRIEAPGVWARLTHDEHYQLEALYLVKVILMDGEKVGIEHEVLFDAARAIIDQKITDVSTWGDLQKIFRDLKICSTKIEDIVKRVDEASDRFVSQHTRL